MYAVPQSRFEVDCMSHCHQECRILRETDIFDMNIRKPFIKNVTRRNEMKRSSGRAESPTNYASFL